jgi:hypothetical protein
VSVFLVFSNVQNLSPASSFIPLQIASAIFSSLEASNFCPDQSSSQNLPAFLITHKNPLHKTFADSTFSPGSSITSHIKSAVSPHICNISVHIFAHNFSTFCPSLLNLDQSVSDHSAAFNSNFFSSQNLLIDSHTCCSIHLSFLGNLSSVSS